MISRAKTARKLAKNGFKTVIFSRKMLKLMVAKNAEKCYYYYVFLKSAL